MVSLTSSLIMGSHNMYVELRTLKRYVFVITTTSRLEMQWKEPIAIAQGQHSFYVCWCKVDLLRSVTLF